MTSPGFFIVFEGGEGAGKSTQASRLAYHLIEAGRKVTLTREPGGTPAGARLRQLMLDPRGPELPYRAEALLMAADRAIHVEQVIRPALDRGDIVISDRYWDSSIAYQGFGRGLGPGAVAWISEWATDNLAPDLVVLLDIDPEVGLSRVADPNRMEGQPMDFHRIVKQGFLRRAGGGGYPWLVVPADNPPDMVAALVAERVARLLQDTAEGHDVRPTAKVIPLERSKNRSGGCTTSP